MTKKQNLNSESNLYSRKIGLEYELIQNLNKKRKLKIGFNCPFSGAVMNSTLSVLMARSVQNFFRIFYFQYKNDKCV